MVEFRDFKKVKGQNIDTVVSFYNGGMYINVGFPIRF